MAVRRCQPEGVGRLLRRRGSSGASRTCSSASPSTTASRPLFLAWARVTLGRGRPRWSWPGAPGVLPSLRGRWRWVAAYAIAEIAIPFPLIGFGEQRVSLVAGGDPHRRGAADHDRAGDPHGPLASAPRGRRLVGLVGRPRAASSRSWASTSPGAPRSCVGALAILLAAAGYATRPDAAQARPQRPRRARDHGRQPRRSRPSCSRRSRALAPPARAPSAGALASIVVLGLLLHRDGLRALRRTCSPRSARAARR